MCPERFRVPKPSETPAPTVQCDVGHCCGEVCDPVKRPGRGEHTCHPVLGRSRPAQRTGWESPYVGRRKEGKREEGKENGRGVEKGELNELETSYDVRAGHKCPVSLHPKTNKQITKTFTHSHLILQCCFFYGTLLY